MGTNRLVAVALQQLMEREEEDNGQPTTKESTPMTHADVGSVLLSGES